MRLKPVTSEKAVKMLDMENIILFEIGRKERKEDIWKEVEQTFNVKVDKVRTLIRGGKKYAYVRLSRDNLAIDLATKLGMI